jgi:hypothetical protein
MHGVLHLALRTNHAPSFGTFTLLSAVPDLGSEREVVHTVRITNSIFDIYDGATLVLTAVG